MERLRRAAQVGNVDELYDCIREEIYVRRYIFDDDDDHIIDGTPLHITAVGGHRDFAMALIYLKPSWGRKLNHEMYSPMHLAVVHGHNELVLALLAVDKDLVRVKGKDGYTALHYAAEKGNLEVLAHFLKDCPECLEDVTIRNETALHVAAQNGKLKALQILARYIRRVHLYCAVSRRHLLNSKDRDGNTVLHIAASKTEPEMVRVLLECQADKRAINKNGVTASDLLETQSSATPNYKELCFSILNLMSLEERVIFLFSWNQRLDPLHEKLRYKITNYELIVTTVTRRMVNMSSDKINALLVVLGLILAATYQALLNPPGGVWQGSYPEANTTTSAETHVGQSIMTSLFFRQFFTLNLMVFVLTSVVTVGLLQFVSSCNVVALISEILLFLLLGCVLLAMQVIEPSDKPRSSLKIKDMYKSLCMTILSILASILFMEFGRRSFHRLLNPPPVRFFRRFIRNQIQM